MYFEDASQQRDRNSIIMTITKCKLIVSTYYSSPDLIVARFPGGSGQIVLSQCAVTQESMINHPTYEGGTNSVMVTSGKGRVLAACKCLLITGWYWIKYVMCRGSPIALIRQTVEIINAASTGSDRR